MISAGYKSAYQQGYSDAMRDFRKKPKIGHWIMTGDYYTGAYGSLDYVRCSCCNYESLEEGNYCPNCGAKMVEPQESEGKDGN